MGVTSIFLRSENCAIRARTACGGFACPWRLELAIRNPGAFKGHLLGMPNKGHSYRYICDGFVGKAYGKARKYIKSEKAARIVLALADSLYRMITEGLVSSDRFSAYGR